MRLKMEPSGNGKTPKITSTPGGSGTQQNGASSSSSSRDGRIHQNGSTKHRSLKSTTTGIVSATMASSSTSSLPTPTVSSSGGSWPQFRFATTLPLRILVLKDLVGAIIGRGGGTIRQITQETHARVDVHRKESSTPNENVIMIYGNPDNCSQACRRILEVMQQEAKSLNRPDEISLKILASNNLIGRIIGKGGNTIKRIMQQTDTKITISSANLSSQYQLERIISILGQLENMCKAEMMISQKLRQCFENDYMQYQQSLMYGSFHSISPLLPPGQSGPLAISSGYVPGPSHSQQGPPMSYPIGTSPTSASLPPSALVGRTSGVFAAGSSVSSPTSSAAGPSSQTHSVPPTPTQGPAAAFYSPYNLAFMYPPHSPGTGSIGTPFGSGPPSASYMNINYLSPMLPNLDNVKETVTIFIPNSVVGAIIGRGGSTIREMMSNSGATIKVTQMSEEESATSTTDGSSNKFLERRVTINGNSFSQSQAQFFVFQKVFTELSNQLQTLSASPGSICPYGDPSILKVEIMVPTNQVRRIIGKGGSVITELQRTSGATIKLSKESTPASSTSSHSKPVSPPSEEQSPTPLSPNGAETTAPEKPSGQQQQQQQQQITTSSDQDMTSVFIIGDFYASLNAQRQIRLIVHRSTSAATTTSVPSSTTTGSSQQQQQHKSMSSKSTGKQFGSSGEESTTTTTGNECKQTTKESITTAMLSTESNSDMVKTKTVSSTTTVTSKTLNTASEMSTPTSIITITSTTTTTTSPISSSCSKPAS